MRRLSFLRTALIENRDCKRERKRERGRERQRPSRSERREREGKGRDWKRKNRQRTRTNRGEGGPRERAFHVKPRLFTVCPLQSSARRTQSTRLSLSPLLFICLFACLCVESADVCASRRRPSYPPSRRIVNTRELHSEDNRGNN